MRAQSKHRIETIVFAVLMIVLYVAFMTIDLVDKNQEISTILKFSSIVCCFLMTIWQCICLRGNKDNLIVCIAFLFTVTADVFLLLQAGSYLYGVIAFSIVQLLYLLRIEYLKEYVLRFEERVVRRRHFNCIVHWIWQVLFRIPITAAICLILYFNQMTVDTLLVITVFYFVNFVGNVILSITLLGKQHYFQGHVPIGLFVAGMILYFLCDLCVGAYNLHDYVTLSDSMKNFIENVVFFGMWGFYLPGQVLIVLSGDKSFEEGI